MRGATTRALALGLAAATLSVIPAFVSPASAAKTSGSIRLVQREPVILGSGITLKGRFKHGGHRRFVIQRHRVSGGTWKSIGSTSGRTNRRGAYKATLTPANSYFYRAVLKATRTKSKRVSKKIQVLVTAQWSNVSAGSEHTCGIRSGDGTLWCWGLNLQGDVGDGTRIERVAPRIVGDHSSPPTWLDVAAGESFTCGIQSGGTLWCWGLNGGNATIGVGDTTTPYFTTPQRLAGAGWTSVSAGYRHACGIQSDGTLWCWGAVNNSALETTPAKVGTDTGWSSVSVGADYTCGIDAGALYCWGDNTSGQLGFSGPAESPTQVGSDTSWTSVSASDVHGNGYFTGGAQTCGLRADPGALYCWGDNSAGQLGDGSVNAQSTPGPQQVGSDTDWTGVSAGGGFTCGVRSSTGLSCWGDNHYGSLGTYQVQHSYTPYAVYDLYPRHDWSGGIDVGPASACGIRDDQTLWCWGWGEYGQLGTGLAYPTTGLFAGLPVPFPTSP